VIAALVLTIALTGSTTSSPPSHGAGTVGPEAARTTTPAPPVGVVVTITQNPNDCTLTVHVANGTDRVGMLSRTDARGFDAPWRFYPGDTINLPVVGQAWSARIDWRDGTGRIVDSDTIGAKAFAPICIGTAPEPQPTTSIGEPYVIVRGGAVEVRRGWGWRV